MGAHVSVCPNHQTGRTTAMNTRAVVAMSGTFGYELDIGKMSEEDKEEVRAQVQSYKEYFDLIQGGDYYRLTKPEEIFMAWQFVSENGDKALLNVVMLEVHGNMAVNYVKLKGLKRDAVYEETATGKTYYGSALMEAGLPMPVRQGEYLAYQMEFVERENMS